MQFYDRKVKKVTDRANIFRIKVVLEGTYSSLCLAYFGIRLLTGAMINVNVEGN